MLSVIHLFWDALVIRLPYPTFISWQEPSPTWLHVWGWVVGKSWQPPLYLTPLFFWSQCLWGNIKKECSFCCAWLWVEAHSKLSLTMKCSHYIFGFVLKALYFEHWPLTQIDSKCQTLMVWMSLILIQIWVRGRWWEMVTVGSRANTALPGEVM